MTKLEILKSIRAKYNEALFTIKDEKRRKAAQRWIDKLNIKILKLEKAT